MTQPTLARQTHIESAGSISVLRRPPDVMYGRVDRAGRAGDGDVNAAYRVETYLSTVERSGRNVRRSSVSEPPALLLISRRYPTEAGIGPRQDLAGRSGKQEKCDQMIWRSELTLILKPTQCLFACSGLSAPPHPPARRPPTTSLPMSLLLITSIARESYPSA
ncbi:hypothetical protein J6590_015170 [Homalodisca vitripennis]|nr:hypothetical protein J6590_015170 [Homalodisca vitripennis]